MATKVFDPTVGKVVEATKKGRNSKGQQIWINKETGKRFIEQENSSTQKKSESKKKENVTTEKKESEKKNTTTTSKKSQETTNIFVNNQLIKTIAGKKLDADGAFDLIKNHFREIASKNCQINSDGDTINIYFKIQTGTKG